MFAASRPKRLVMSNDVAKMMKELDELEKEIEGSPAQESASPKALDIGTGSNDDDFWGKGTGEAGDSMEDTLAAVKPEHSGNSVFDQAQETAEEEKPMAKQTKTGSGELTLRLSGDMTLNLEYSTGGQFVMVSFADGFLKIELADGTEFKVPMNGGHGAGSESEAA
jgi:hypothetical protein